MSLCGLQLNCGQSLVPKTSEVGTEGVIYTHVVASLFCVHATAAAQVCCCSELHTQLALRQSAPFESRVRCLIHCSLPVRSFQKIRGPCSGLEDCGAHAKNHEL